MKGWQFYQTNALACVPYMADTPVFRDGMLPYLYTKTKEEGKLEDTFCGDTKNMDAFITYFDLRKTMQVLCTVSLDEHRTPHPVGYSWVDNPRGVDGARVAMCGMCFFEDASITYSARTLARLALAYAFNDLRIDVFHGVQVESNIAAKNFSEKLGFKVVANVPKYHFIKGELVGARVMMLKAEDFLPPFFAWKERQDIDDKGGDPEGVDQNLVESAVTMG